MKEYLKQGAKIKKVKLILEIKPHETKENEDLAVVTICSLVKKYKLEEQVEYISFSLNICKELVRLSPFSQIAYLNGELSPKELKEIGLSGLDYSYKILYKKPQWIEEAKQLGMTVNSWTINKEEDIKAFIDLNLDFITTDNPQEAIKLISNR